MLGARPHQLEGSKNGAVARKEAKRLKDVKQLERDVLKMFRLQAGKVEELERFASDSSHTGETNIDLIRVKRERDENLREFYWLVMDLQGQNRQQAARIKELEKTNQYLVANR
jgi:hypothetical protein